MDYYSFDSEVIESLNLLRPPPVRSGPANSKKDFSVYNNCTKNSLKVLRGFGHNHTAKRVNSCQQTSQEDSSTSLILKKTSERQILKQYPDLSYTSLHCEEQSSLQKVEQNTDAIYVKRKPLIQVTVIPKSCQNPGLKLLRKQRTVPNTAQATSSNHENSIQTKNVYLVVAGRKKDKIYEIKTTGSEKFDKQFVPDEGIEKLRNFKQLIKSLNMDRKRKKDKKKDSRNDCKNEAQINFSKTRDTNFENVCNCSPEDVHDMRSGKSRVRIFGRIGLTEDDKYVLKCQATVDDKPVPTSLSTAEKQSSSTSLAAYSRNGQAPAQRHSIMQTAFCNNAVNDLLKSIDIKNKIRKDSQSTQVNLDKPNGNSMNKTSPLRAREQVTRCNCSNNYDYPIVKTLNNEYGGKNLKPCQSPLVIISMFPKQDNNLTDLVQTVQCAQIDSKRPTFPENTLTENTSSNNEINKTKNIKRSARSRSPKPKVQNQKTIPKLKQTVETRYVKTGARSVSPPRSKLGKKDLIKATNSSKHTLQFFNSNTKKEGTDKKLKSSSPRSPRVKTPPATPKTNALQKKNASRQSLKPKANLPRGKVDKGINTEHMKTKKALIDSYTKKITEQMKSNKYNPDKCVSTVSVNIDSENEYYDVSFRKDEFTTDLKIRKTMKEASAQKSSDVNQTHGSMENFFPNMSKKHRKSNVCRQSTCEQLNQSDDLKFNAPRLTLRDSLEIGHRREDKITKNNQTGRTESEELTVNSAAMEFFAPIKHYTGDDCTIRDPVERDREIRELLGVAGRWNKNNPQNQEFAMGDQISRHCFYSKQCDNTFVTAFALKNTCECIDESTNYDDVNITNNKTKSIMPSTRTEGKRKSDAKQKPRGTDNDCGCICPSKKHKSGSKSNPQDSERQCPCSGNNDIICNIPTCNKNNQTQRKSITSNLPDQNEKETSEYVGANQTETDQNTDSPKDSDAERNFNDQYELPKLDTTSLFQQLTLNRNIQIFLQVEQFAKQKPIVLSKKQYDKIKKTIQDTVGKGSQRCVCNRSVVSVGPKFGRRTHNVFVCTNREVQTDAVRRETSIKERKRHIKSHKHSSKKEKRPVDTVVLFSNETRGNYKAQRHPNAVKRATSSLEIRNASVAYWKHVTFSSTNVGSIGSKCFALRNKNSIETIYRGHKKSHTPNLGTSVFSLLSEANISESQSMKQCSPDKTKKPFLKRLMSCLVLRSKTSEKVGPQPVSYPARVNSSVDSYHINSSLMGIEMTSSMFDTSASFYSNHSIHPLSSKLKRSFLSSVRGFLTSRKS